MILKKPYIYYNKVFDDSFCKKVIDLGLSKLQDGQTNDKKDSANAEMTIAGADKTKEQLEKEGVLEKTFMRKSKIAWLRDKWIYNSVLPFINDANKIAGWKWDFDTIEQAQFTRYTENEFYGWHADGNSDHLSVYNNSNSTMTGKVRKISVTINLVDGNEYEGGNLKFDFGPHAGVNRFKEIIEIRPKGSIVIFPSFTYHQVTPVTKGTRYSLVLWCIGKPWR